MMRLVDLVRPELRRLNMDTSWLLRWGSTDLLLDPWLVGSEVDGFSWFNEQWHVTPPIAPEQVASELEAASGSGSRTAGIVVTQSYADHCHDPTLRALPATLPIVTVDRAERHLRKTFVDRTIFTLANQSAPAFRFGELDLTALRPARRMDPIYYLLVIRRENRAIAYCPHGYHPTDGEQAWLQTLDIVALLTTFTDFRLPSWLGGQVSPGLENVHQLVGQLQPTYVLNCHDEQKAARGIVQRLARVKPAELDAVQIEGTTFIPSENYDSIAL